MKLPLPRPFGQGLQEPPEVGEIAFLGSIDEWSVSSEIHFCGFGGWRPRGVSLVSGRLTVCPWWESQSRCLYSDRAAARVHQTPVLVQVYI